MTIIYYPDIDDPQFYQKILKKKEFYSNKYDIDIDLDDYKQVKKQRDAICMKNPFQQRKLLPHQKLLKNFISPKTPYKSLLLFHGTGVGKTCASISIAEQFVPMVAKYNTKIIVLVTGPILKQNFIDELMGACTDHKYENIKQIKKYYTVMSYRSFFKRVLGEKQRNKYGKIIKINGNIKREIILNPIKYLINTLIICDEAHNITNNETGDAIQMVLNHKKTKNVKILLLTATPMKNKSTDIISLMNFILPIDKKLNKKDIFNKNDEIINPQLFIEKTKGYISYIKGENPITFAQKDYKGTILKPLTFLKVIPCLMEQFQLNNYKETYDKLKNDGLMKQLQNSSNIGLFHLKNNKLVFNNGNEALSKLKNNIINDKQNLIQKLKKYFKNISNDFVSLDKNKNITGQFLHKKYIKHFSTKYHQILNNILNTQDEKIFVFSSMVGIGIELFANVLIQNGFKEYSNTQINQKYRCYKCNKFKNNHDKQNHVFKPASFIFLTGDTEDVNDIKRAEMLKIFNSDENIDGSIIKIIAGTTVLAEGTSLFYVNSVHITEPHFNLTRNDQIIGRAIRQCSHYKNASDKNPFPKVKIYQYVAITNDDKYPSNDVVLYKKCEDKYKGIKQIERIIKENAVDCVFNYDINQNKMFKDWTPECDFQKCSFKCNHNTQLFDGKKYKNVDKLDETTYTIDDDIKKCIQHVKQMFKYKIYYSLQQIIEYIKQKYDDKKMFKNIYVYKALDHFLPQNDNEINQMTDYLVDKYENKGYLIHRGKYYYIFQPFNKNIKTTINKRNNIYNFYCDKISLNEYVNGKKKDLKQNIIDT